MITPKIWICYIDNVVIVKKHEFENTHSLINNIFDDNIYIEKLVK